MGGVFQLLQYVGMIDERKNNEPMKALTGDRRTTTHSRLTRAWMERLPAGAFYPGIALGGSAALLVLYLLGAIKLSSDADANETKRPTCRAVHAFIHQTTA